MKLSRDAALYASLSSTAAVTLMRRLSGGGRLLSLSLTACLSPKHHLVSHEQYGEGKEEVGAAASLVDDITAAPQCVTWC